MAITLIKGSQPDSVYFFTRKGTPKPLGNQISGNLSWEHVDALGASAVTWKKPIGFKPDVNSTSEHAVKEIKARALVYWPGSEVKVEGYTRAADGKQKIEPTFHVVQGRPMAVETRDDLSGAQNVQRQMRFSGVYLKSAPVKFQGDNFLISAPRQNEEQITMGRAEVARSARLLQASTVLKAWVELKQGQLNAGQLNDKPELRQKIQQGIAKGTAKYQALVQQGTQLKAQGEKNVTAGEVLRSTVVSIGAVANTPTVQVVNPRVAGERGLMHTHSGTVAIQTGNFKGEVAAFQGDKLVMTLNNPAVANQKVGSRMEVELRVPNPDANAKPVATIDGQKFFRPVIEHVEAFHDQAQPLPQ